MSERQAQNRASIEELLARPIEAPIGKGKTLILTRPARQDFLAFNNELANLKDEELRQDVNRGYSIIERAVRLCIPEIKSDDEAYHIIQASGGDNSELVQMCIDLCTPKKGEVDEEADEAAAELDPTPSTSPAPPAEA